MNNNLKDQKPSVIIKRPSLQLEVPKDRLPPMVNLKILNPFLAWNDKLASTKEGNYLAGYMKGLKDSKKRYKEMKNSLSSPAVNILGEFNDSLIETNKEAFVLGYIQGINKNDE